MTNETTNIKESLCTPPPEQEEGEELRKQYENMSYSEMSSRLAENYKQLSEILGNRISLPTTESSSDDEEEEQDDYKLLDRTDLNNELKKTKLTKLFLKSVSSGDLEKVSSYLSNDVMKEFIDINGKDEDGTTPLIYAACFGKFEIAQVLLLAGANIDDQDSHGWSALMWATTNNHEGLVKLLLENGASSQTKSSKGRTVLDFVKNDTHKIADMVLASSTSNRNSISSTSSITGFTAAGSNSSTSSNAGDNDRYYQYSTDEHYDSFIKHDNECKPELIEEYLRSSNQNEEEDEEDEEDEDDDEDDYSFEERKERMIKPFDWDRCMPDQMFVFGAEKLPHILDSVITKSTLPVVNKQDIFLPANVIFLSARFAHYFSSAELAEDVMEGALHRISIALKSNTQNVHILSYWMTNITRLLYYLKKDAELMVATAEYQLRLSELISETYNYIVNDIGKRITCILEPSMLEFDPFSGMMDDVNFVDDWQRFFRRSSASMQRSNNSSQISTKSDLIVLSPKSIIQLFSSTYNVFQLYEVHSTIIIQALAQFLHFLSCELFNHILSKKKYLCRSKAIQVRMNLSFIEEWIRDEKLPTSLISYLNPSIQLVQFLQCLSQLDTIQSFQSTIKLFDSINTLQIRRCVFNYRYETNEQRLPEEIEKFVQQTVDETIRLKQARQSRSFERRRRSGPPILNKQQSQSLRRSLSGRGDNMNQIIASILTRSSITIEERPLSSSDEDEDEHDKESNETKDSRFMLPFFIPTTAQLSATNDHFSLIPVIPEDWIIELDEVQTR